MSRLATLDLEKTEATINLHKAAPDLLAVCADLVESAEYWGEYDVPIGIVDRLNAAIAKAGGTALRTPESCHWQKGIGYGTPAAGNASTSSRFWTGCPPIPRPLPLLRPSHQPG